VVKCTEPCTETLLKSGTNFCFFVVLNFFWVNYKGAGLQSPESECRKIGPQESPA